MAISVANLLVNSSTTDATSFTTASISPSAGTMVLLSVIARDNPTPPEPTVSGGGMDTWTLVDGTTRLNTSGLWMWRATDSSPGSGAITIDFGAQTINSLIWIVDEATGVVVTGTNGSDGILQPNAVNAGNGTTFGITLSALSSANNVAYAAIAHLAVETQSPDNGFTELADKNISNDGATMSTNWLVNATNPSASWTTSSARLGCALELVASEVGSVIPPRSFATLQAVNAGVFP